MSEEERDARPAVAVLGLGSMGRAIANAVVGSTALSVWNRSPAREGHLRSVATVTASPVEAASASDIMLFSLIDNAAVRDVLGQCADALTGHTVVNVTNGTPDEARSLAEWVEAHHARYLHGAIMATPPMIGRVEARLLYSGSAEAFDAAKGTLELLGTPSFIGADPGRAPLFELALLSTMYGLYGGFFHAAGTIAAEGDSLADLAALAQPWVAGLAASLPRLADQMAAAVYDQNVVASLSTQARGLDHFAAWCSSRGISGDLLEPLRRLVAMRIADGYGEHGIASVFEGVRPPLRD